MYKKVIGVFLIGAILGLGARAFMIYMEGRQPAVVFSEEVEPGTNYMSIECTGGAENPSIEINLHPQIVDSIAGLERSIDGGPWKPADKILEVGDYLYRDTGIELGRTYSYKITKPGISIESTETITTSAENCASQ
jgi:hypothetical protein